VTTSHLLYLHGFRSSPLSNKARILGAWVARHAPQVVWHCPQLEASPRSALQQALGAVAGWPIQRMAVVGSSLGGFYATVLAERLGCKAVLLNPAVNPQRDLTRYVGEVQAWHSENRFEFRAEYIEQLRAMRPVDLTHLVRYYAVIARGDELLDWREMTARYAGARIKLLEGSDHALSDFEQHLAGIAKFLGLPSREGA